MLQVTDISVFFQKNTSDIPDDHFETPKKITVIESWTAIRKGKSAVIKGRLLGHPDYPDGVKMMTSTVHRYLAGDGHVYIKTQNSLYELGQPLKTTDLQKLERMTQ
ncbi:hypothetical protein [Acaryochloris marina]|uniref:hypothetical protein n=1 Tax=Acaryochloris marina TaxID=155978 RepID=UPI0021C3108D|nr:hypothetical protein [Acaryochloris marina]BDM83692.1 hypothetical protein AM10699_65530 [Acaryochloris marina MBIC10699]